MAEVLNYEPPSSRMRPPLAFSRVAAVAVVALGTMALVGWVTGFELLKSFLHPGKIAMNPATAACFILAGAALWLSLPPGRTGTAADSDAPDGAARARRGALVACAGAVALVGLLKLATFFGFWNVGIDRVLFRAQLGSNVMAPNTAFTFVLVGAALLMLDVTVLGRLRPARLLTLLATAVALLALIGYLYDVSALYQPTQKYIAMALNTAMGFLALSLGLLGARPDREPIRTLISDTAGGVIARRLLPAAIVLPILLGWLHLRAVGEEAVLEHVGLPVMVTTLIALVTLVSLTWGTARSLHRVDVERARAERAVADNYRLMRTLIDNLPDYIFVKDAENRFLINNAAHVRVLGAASQAEVLGKRDEDFFGPEVAARFHDDDAAVIRSGAAQADKEERVVQPGGEERWVNTTKVPFRDADGAVAGLVGIAHDITERKRAESLLRAQNELLDQSARSERQAHEALKRAQSHLVQNEKLASLGQMVAGVAHEINNPLSFVANNVAVLQRDLRGLATMIDLYRRADPTIAAHQPDLAAELREAATRLDVNYTLTNIPELLVRSREGLRRIQQIVKDLRDFARLDESDLHDIDLNEGIRSTVNIILGVAKKRQVKVEMDLAPLPRFSCYPAKINQVVMNLLANAIQASHEGDTVAVRSSHDNGAVRIQVADQGSGIPEHIRGRIFDPFFTTKPPGEGTGLGLSISYGIIQDHGGRIDLETETGKGSTFTVTLPLRRSAEIPNAPATGTSPVVMSPITPAPPV
jgi:two-component system NtrC family sensor kinase